jgi:hypothetical protein
MGDIQDRPNLGRSSSAAPPGRRVERRLEAWMRSERQQPGFAGGPALTELPLPSPKLLAAIAVTAISATFFVVALPHVGDMWAALARAEAARAGVGLNYWFGWYSGGTAPGAYSVLSPMLSALVGTPALLAISTVAAVTLAYFAVRGMRRPYAALLVITIVASANLWSGRVPFALGCAIGLLAVLAMQSGRRYLAALAGIATVLASPVAGAFLILGAASAALATSKQRSATVMCAAASGLALIGIGLWYGTPGPEGLSAGAAIGGAIMLVAMLLAQPSRAMTTLIIISVAAIPILAIVPNGMGSNIERLVYIVAPVGVAATSRARPAITAIAIIPALIYGLVATATDLAIAYAPNSQLSYYTGLQHELGNLQGQLAGHRLEVVSNGTHAAAYVLLSQAALARGYETQADAAYDAVLSNPKELTSATYDTWLAQNAVAYVAVDRTPLTHTPEYNLVIKDHPAYLNEIWADQHWSLYRVEQPMPIVSSPARYISSTQGQLVLRVDRAESVFLRLRYSRLLKAIGPEALPNATMTPTPAGWTELHTFGPGTYLLHGAA